MTISDEALKNFFQRDIIGLFEDKVDSFLSHYSIEQVIQCLFDRLKSFEYGEDAWRLARVFADISKKYSVDTHIYSWLKTSTLNEKKILLNFLAGYYEGATPNFEIVMKISEKLVETIANLNEFTWDGEAISLAIEAVALGYVNNKQFFKENQDLEDKLKPRLIFFKTYISKADPKSPGSELLSKYLE
jgi:hypothetical protein